MSLDKTTPTGLSGEDLASLGHVLLHTMPDAVIYADRDGIIGFWNTGAERLFGFAGSEAVGQSLDIIIPEGLRARHWHGYRRMMETGLSQHAPDDILTVPARTRSGETRSIEFTVAPVPDGDGRIAGIIAILRDVTATFQELKRLRAAAR